MTMQVGVGIKGKTKGKLCAGCGHPLDEHTITTTRNSSTVSGMCKKCKCKGISIEE